MKNKLSENIQNFIYGAVIDVLVGNDTSKLTEAIIGFAVLETIWLVIRMSFRRHFIV